MMKRCLTSQVHNRELETYLKEYNNEEKDTN